MAVFFWSLCCLSRGKIKLVVKGRERKESMAQVGMSKTEDSAELLIPKGDELHLARVVTAVCRVGTDGHCEMEEGAVAMQLAFEDHVVRFLIVLEGALKKRVLLRLLSPFQMEA